MLSLGDRLALAEKIGGKILTWHASMLSLGDRLSLVRHVLCDIPNHFLIAISLNKSILTCIILAIRGFL